MENRERDAGEGAGLWLEQGITKEMKQNQEILGHLERLASKMESVLAGQQKLEKALHTSRVIQGREAASSRPAEGQRPHLLEASRSKSPLPEAPAHEKPTPPDLANVDPTATDSSASQPLTDSVWSASIAPLEQRVLVPVDDLAAGGDEQDQSPLLLEGDMGSAGSMETPTMSSFERSRTWARCRCLPVNPDSKFRTAIDVASCVVLSYDCIVIPIQLGWDVPLEGVYLVGYAVTLSFWTGDFLLGFATSHYRGGDLVTDSKSIAKHYLKTDFLLNFIAVSIDWVVIIVQLLGPENASADTRFARAIRVVKVHRLVHLVRVMKNGNIAMIYDKISRVCFKHGLVEQFQTGTKILSLFVLILWLNHLGCCFWNWVSSAARREYMNSHVVQEGASEYLIVYYWSVSAIIAGESIMDPTDNSELATAIIFILCGLILVGMLVSHLSALLLDVRIKNQQKNSNMSTLRQYFYQNRVKQELAMPIQAKVSERLSAAKKYTDKDVKVLDLIPPAMRNMLRTEVYGQTMQTNFFIRACSSLPGSRRSVIMDFCCTAMSNEVLKPGSVVFHEKEEAKQAYYLNWGECEYVRGGLGHRSTKSSLGSYRTQARISASASARGETVGQGTWISEVALWVLWKHCGLLEVSKQSEMCIISADAFMQVIKLNPNLVAVTQDYSNAMYAAIQRERRRDISDLRIGVDNESVITAMPRQTRVRMSMGAFNSLLSENFVLPGMRAKRKLLYSELQAGKCDLIINSDEEVLRVVNVVALRVLRHDGKMLSQIAEVADDGAVEPSVQLPGLKVKAGELPHDALQRLQSTTLSALSGGIIVGRREVNVEEKASKAYGVKTKYMRNVYHAGWDVNFAYPDPLEVRESDASNHDSVRSGSVEVVPKRSRSGKFKDWLALTPFVVDSGSPDGTRKILLWAPPEDFSTLLADEDYAKELMSHYKVPPRRTPSTSSGVEHEV